jgi:hypothetical protein
MRILDFKIQVTQIQVKDQLVQELEDYQVHVLALSGLLSKFHFYLQATVDDTLKGTKEMLGQLETRNSSSWWNKIAQ